MTLKDHLAYFLIVLYMNVLWLPFTDIHTVTYRLIKVSQKNCWRPDWRNESNFYIGRNFTKEYVDKSKTLGLTGKSGFITNIYYDIFSFNCLVIEKKKVENIVEFLLKMFIFVFVMQGL